LVQDKQGIRMLQIRGLNVSIRKIERALFRCLRDNEKQDGIKAVLSNWVGSAGQVSNLLIHDLKVIGELINLNPGFIRTEYSFNSDDNMTMLIVLV
jgi:hypothetical protein